MENYSNVSDFGPFMAVMGGFFFVLLIILIVGYVLMALGLMGMANKKNLENTWMAWVPVANMWLLGQLIETIDFGENKIPNASIILVVGSFISFVPVVGTILSLAFLVVLYASYYKLYKMFAPGKEVLYLVLSIVVGISMPVILFIIRNNDPVEV